jgi:aspartyl-tRNA(Asn)/glutamyl-tRNA(Gln) amidotransferase subunit C
MISIEEVRKLSKLARIDFSEDDLQGFQKEMEAILDYVGEIQSVSPKEVEVFISENHNVLREDEFPHDSGTYKEDILTRSPKRSGDYVEVKKVL